MTAVLPERATLARPDYATPDLEPDDGKRVTVRAWRRELADWLRAHGIGASGASWDLAITGERDLTALRMAAATDDTLARHWSGNVMPAALAGGDVTDWGPVTGVPITDPETGAVWITTRHARSGATDHDTVAVTVTYSDHELPVGVPVRVMRGRGDLS